MKTIIIKLTIVIVKIIAINALFTASTFGQGNNWKLNLNNNLGINDGIGSSNNADLKFFTNNQHRMSLTKDGDLLLGGEMTSFSGSLILNFPLAELRDDNVIERKIAFGGDYNNGFNFTDIKIGIGTQSPAMMLHIKGDGFNSTNNGAILAESGALVNFIGPIVPNFPAVNAVRFLWYPKKAAIRAGSAADEWDDVNIGLYSAAFGSLTKASGDASFAVGSTARALGNASVAMGENTETNAAVSFVGGNDVNIGLLSRYSFGFGQFVNIEQDCEYSYAHGLNLSIGNSGPTLNAYVFGNGLFLNPLDNSTSNSFMVGFQSDVSTFFIEPPAVPGSGAVGNVGIGTENPFRRLEVVANATPQLRLTQTSNQFFTDFQTSGGNLYIRPYDGFLLTPGNVGINLNFLNPALERLDVNGNGRYRAVINNGTNDVLVTGSLNGTTGNEDDVTLSTLAFPGNPNLSLLGDGTFGSAPGAPDVDWTGAGSGLMRAYYLNDKVLIGTTSPGNAKLFVYTTSQEVGATIMANASLAHTGLWGSIKNSTISNAGVRGISQSNSPTAFNRGVVGDASGSSRINRGVQANAIGNAVVNYGTYSTAHLGATNIGVFAAVSGGSSGNDRAGYFNGDLEYTGALIPSDVIFKENIEDIEDATTIIAQLQPRTFNFDTTAFPINFSSGLRYGFIAQEINQILPDIVSNSVFPAQYDSSGNQISPEIQYKSLNYEALIPILTQSMKEQQQLIDSLYTMVEECCNQMNFKTTGGNEGGEINEPIKEKLSSKGVILYDAIPNPFQGEVSIGFFIPERIIHAEIVFHDNFGRTLKTVQVDQRGNGTVIIDASDLASGIYTYGIITDGQAIDTKKMIRSK